MLLRRPAIQSIRREVLVLLAFFLLALIITYPAVLHVRDSSWLADSVNDPDDFIKLWDVWSFDKLIHGQQAFFHTDMLFYPVGLDLTYHTYNLPHMLVVYALIPLTGSVIAAFNLTAILFTTATAYSGYLLIRYLLASKDEKLNTEAQRHRETEKEKESNVGTRYSASATGSQSADIQKNDETSKSGFLPLELKTNNQQLITFSSFYGGCVLGFSQWVVHNFRHPDLSFLVTFTLGMLLFIYACRKHSLRAGIGAGILLGVTAYIGMYIVVVMGIVMAAYTLISLKNHARYPRFWLTLIACGVAAGIIAVPRILPMVRGNLTFALEDKYSSYLQSGSIDLVNFFVPANHPVWGSQFTLPPTAARYHMFYLGWIPLLLALLALIRRRYRREALFWLALMVFFMLMGMGTILNINGVGYPDVPMLKTLMDKLPVVFEAFGRPDNFQIGVVLPLAICAAYGLNTLLHRRDTENAEDSQRNIEKIEKQAAGSLAVTRNSELRTRNFYLGTLIISLVLIFLTLFELSAGEYPGRDVMAGVSPYYQQLAGEPGDFALIQLPTGRTPSKSYVFYQTIHGKPIVEGLASRTPDGAYDYINNGNSLLAAWNRQKALDCSAFDLASALDELTAANFRDVVIQKNLKSTDIFKSYFQTTTPSYEDEDIVVYRLSDLREKMPC